jgi:mRNA interferase RelE/StbE
VQERIVGRIEELAAEPRPRGAVKLQGEDDLYRIRVGDYRVVYTIRDEELIVLVLRVGHRRDVYRDSD